MRRTSTKQATQLYKLEIYKLELCGYISYFASQYNLELCGNKIYILYFASQ